MISFYTTVYGTHYLKVSEEDVVSTKELIPDLIYADFDSDGLLVGVQVFAEDPELKDFVEDVDDAEDTESENES